MSDLQGLGKLGLCLLELDLDALSLCDVIQQCFLRISIRSCRNRLIDATNVSSSSRRGLRRSATRLSVIRRPEISYPMGKRLKVARDQSIDDQKEQRRECCGLGELGDQLNEQASCERLREPHDRTRRSAGFRSSAIPRAAWIATSHAVSGVELASDRSTRATTWPLESSTTARTIGPYWVSAASVASSAGLSKFHRPVEIAGWLRATLREHSAVPS